MNDKSNKDPDQVYDMVIDIQSLSKLKEGWEIKYYGSEVNQTRVKNISKQKYLRISVIGNANRGKTFILQKISKLNFDGAIGHTVSTQGLSIKFPQKNEYVLLDTLGNNSPILIDDIENDPRDNENYEESVKKEIKDRLISNYIIQNFIIQKADIIICVVGQLTTSEQQFLNKVKNTCKNKINLYIIHNLVNLDKKMIPKYIENVLKKSVTFKLIENTISSFENNDNPNFFNIFYEEKSNNDEEELPNVPKTFHFILGKEEKGKDDIKYYNDSTINYIKKKFNDSIKKQHDNILEELKTFLIDISGNILENKISNDDLKIEDNKIICENIDNNSIRNIRADELDNIIFLSNEQKYTPLYRYYRDKDLFIIELFLNGNYSIEDDYKFINKNEIQFEIFGKLENVEEEEEEINEEFTIIYKKSGDNTLNDDSFKIEFIIDANDYNIKTLNPTDDEKCNGILSLNYKIKNRSNN